MKTKKVKITNAIVRTNKNGEEFTSLIITGGIETIISKETGKSYITAKKCSVPSTLDIATAEMMIGEELEGEIIKIECDPYEFTNSDGKKVKLDFRYEFQQAESTINDEVYEH